MTQYTELIKILVIFRVDFGRLVECCIWSVEWRNYRRPWVTFEGHFSHRKYTIMPHSRVKLTTTIEKNARSTNFAITTVFIASSVGCQYDAARICRWAPAPAARPLQPPGVQQQTRRPPPLLSIDGTDRRRDAWPLHIDLVHTLHPRIADTPACVQQPRHVLCGSRNESYVQLPPTTAEQRHLENEAKRSQWWNENRRIFTARCYASAVLAMAVCLSVCPSQVGVLLKRLNVGLHK